MLYKQIMYPGREFWQFACSLIKEFKHLQKLHIFNLIEYSVTLSQYLKAESRSIVSKISKRKISPSENIGYVYKTSQLLTLPIVISISESNSCLAPNKVIIISFSGFEHAFVTTASPGTH